MRTKTKAKKDKNPDLVTYLRRDIPSRTKLLLAVKSGGRCALCNLYLFEDPLTGVEGNFAQRAHIVGFSEGGPRAQEDLPGGIHGVENLMHLCYTCHRIVDKEQPEKYPGRFLRQKNDAHNGRIKWLTSIAPDKKTTVIKLVARVNSDMTVASNIHIAEAVAPLYPSADPLVIDLSTIPGNADSIALAVGEVSKKVGRLFETGAPLDLDLPVSVFAIGPIPLLVHLGHTLTNKVRVAPYQRHRDTDDWKWKEAAPVARFGFDKLSEGSDADGVGLVLSLSGTVQLDDLPDDTRGKTIYEITLKDMTPNPGFLGRQESLKAFRETYRSAIARIQELHPAGTPILLFPAVPAPVAVCCGLDLLPKVHPPLHVYDFDRAQGGFTLQHKVLNDNQR